MKLKEAIRVEANPGNWIEVPADARRLGMAEGVIQTTERTRILEEGLMVVRDTPIDTKGRSEALRVMAKEILEKWEITR